MPTNTQGTVARNHGVQLVHYISKDFGFADLLGETIVGVIPAGARILRCTLAVTEAFDDTNGDDIDIGFSDGAAELGSAMDANSTAVDAGDVAAGDIVDTAVDRTVYVAATTTPSGDGATGTGTVVVEYTID